MARARTEWAKRANIAMIEKNISCQDIADKLDLTRQYVASIVYGRVNSPQAIARISSLLDISDDPVSK